MAVHETKQEFLGVDINEVSLVDRPAVEEEWLVIKRLEGKPNVEAALPPQLEKQETKKMAEDKKVEKSDAKPDAKVEPATESAPEASTQEADVKKATELFEQATALLAPHKPAEPDADAKADAKPDAKPEPDPVPVVKALIGIQDGRLVIDQDMLEVAKAKTFSKGRTEALETATKAMITLLKEVAPDTVQKLMGGEVSTQKSTESESEPKMIIEAITTAVTKALEPLDTRLKQLEGAKAPPKSGDNDQIAEVKKSNDSVWAGSALGQ